MLLSKKFEELKGQTVTVMDYHYAGGYPVRSEIHEIKDANGKVVNHVAFDTFNKIIAVFMWRGEIVFANDITFGGLDKNGKLEGWCYDRDGYTIEGFESSGWYKESSVS